MVEYPNSGYKVALKTMVRRLRWRSLGARLRESLMTPVDGASLAVVRIAVGLMGATSVVRLWALDRIGPLFADPEHHLSYPGLAWVPRLDPDGVHLLSLVILATSVLLVVGWRTRLVALGFALAFTWFEWHEASTYLNHYWLVSLLALLLAIVPSGDALSLDARAGRVAGTVAMHVWAVRVQLALVYAFAGLAKLHPDWLVDAMPLRLWLPARAEVLPLVGALLAEPWVAHVASIAAAGFDLSIGLLLLWRWTYRFAWLAVIGFHLATWILFPSIGLFPFVMMAASTVFLSPSWPRRFLRRSEPSPLPAPGGRLGWVAMALGAWVAVQVAVPLRHVVDAGDPRWTGVGYRFAWNVLAMEKAGSLVFRVSDGRSTWFDDGGNLFTEHQLTVAASDPTLIVQVAHAVGRYWEDRHGGPIRVTAESFVSVNGGAPTTLMDPGVDLYALDASAIELAVVPPAR
jgi:vitamin K-dependent gamma-carboxylase